MALQHQGEPSPIQVAFDAVTSASNTANLALECFSRLGALFRAIAKLSDEHDIAHHLSRIGEMLADDFANTHDCEREVLEEHFKSFCALLHPDRESGNA